MGGVAIRLTVSRLWPLGPFPRRQIEVLVSLGSGLDSPFDVTSPLREFARGSGKTTSQIRVHIDSGTLIFVMNGKNLRLGQPTDFAALALAFQSSRNVAAGCSLMHTLALIEQ